ncbi:MAG: hypothetical protein CMI54_05790 [Parcubacteria group bacterium]|nr:hypothetical protein [Parcubacteria group bacterium]|tara:strand:- start:6416 stop:7027 length:612 start_codon:yes stop_codon:yes gene_type:complete
MITSKLICEHDLPLPSSLEEDEDQKRDFRDVKWDELDFFTSSFFDFELGEDKEIVSHYTISEDGQFYKSKVEIVYGEDEDGKEITKEKDKGIEKQEFTGEILFGAEIFGENHDYTTVFRALLYKGDLKEIELNDWKKDNNKHRKEVEKIQENMLLEWQERRSSLKYKVFSAIFFVIKWILFIPYKILHKTIYYISKLEAWIKI